MTDMSAKTYRAIQVSRPGHLEMVDLPLVPPGPGQVRIRVEACGICHTDAMTVEGGVTDIVYPRVPGHEVVGCIDALGEGVTGWALGRRVGVGFLAGNCGSCAECRRGHFTACRDQRWTGVHHDGGYAEMMLAQANALVSIPDALAAVEAAPLLCAGITVFKALKKSGARPGDIVAIHGVGGLGHLAVQFARKMGFRTVAIARGREKEGPAKALGAHHYINSAGEDAAAALLVLGGARVIVSTVTAPKAISPLVAGLAPHGRLMVVGVGAEPVEISPFALVQNDVSVSGSLTGTTIESEDSLAFSVLQDIRALVETVPLAEARQAYDRMMRNQAQFRIVLTM
ncbi:alcohol dehydrogenase [Nitrospirillum viridazoti]|uniref:Alcohol dehydrogenase n=1 Tax=Nitrospirillum viridazoti CBAmc TaxID=1441467 RepID=A0A248JRD5_9PROT|nr:alcohol dehydrogenase [Nitrospirillum amazonense]ASG21051.1 alcohol dehydrogenase [Nitrospirillum amazonense CBAmc]TWB32448.1 propanol-preferring alcohol dehydrogenase [Nitrospirillum amazonense]